MTAEEFKNAWTQTSDTLSPLTPSRLHRLNLLPSTVEFLTQSGLPFSAAPFLTFALDKDDIIYGINKLTTQYNFLGTEYEKYIVIGCCADGDPIAINTDCNDQIERLDHEDLFSSSFFNTSIECMAGCLIAYRDFVSTVQKENGEDAILNSNFSDEHFETLRRTIETIDGFALIKDGFWKEELEMELALRANERNKK